MPYSAAVVDCAGLSTGIGGTPLPRFDWRKFAETKDLRLLICGFILQIRRNKGVTAKFAQNKGLQAEVRFRKSYGRPALRGRTATEDSVS
jgi:hypothetical protein